MRLATLGFAAGAACLQRQASQPEPWTAAVAAGVLLAAAWPMALRLRRQLAVRQCHTRATRLVQTAWTAGAAVLAGFFWAAWLAHWALAPALAYEDEGRDLVIVGTVDSLPHRFGNGVRFQFALERVETAHRAVPPRIAVSWYSAYRDGRPGSAPLDREGDVQPGERWRLTVRLQRPHGNVNPHGFDYEAWLLQQGVRATGYVRADAGNRRLDAFVPSPGNVVARCRAALRARIVRALDGEPYAGVIVALVVGDQRGIGQSDWQVFNRTGIGHLVSISGLHITMVAGLFALAAHTLWRHSLFTRAQLPLRVPAQKVAAAAGALFALLYVLLAGFGVPAQRTLYMLLVVAAALWLNRLSSVSHVLCAALGVVVVLDPWAVLSPGFWLSFGAVAVIIYATAGRTSAQQRRADCRPGQIAAAQATDARTPGGLSDTRLAQWGGRAWSTLRIAARTQYAVTLGLVPLTMLLFAQVSVISPLANAVAIPLISLLVTPLALVGSLLPWPLATAALGLAHGLIEALASVLVWGSGLRYAVWTAPAPPFWLFCWALAGTAWLLAPRGWPVRWLGLATWIPLLAAQPTHPAPGRLTVTAFDVGQGTALLVETSGHRLLYDAGPAYGAGTDAGANAGARIIVPYLRSRGVAKLDAMVVSHGDADHAGGALAVLGAVPTGLVLSSLPPGHGVRAAAPRHVACAAGQHWHWDGVRFEVLHPHSASYGERALKPNARSCTLKITAGDGGKSVLLAGDIEAAQEVQLLARYPGQMQLAADVLLAPHHGSGTSSTLAFLRAVAPQLAVFQVGHRNRYRHPKDEIYARYGELGIERLRTDRVGALTIELGPTLTVSSERQRRPRYWHGR